MCKKYVITSNITLEMYENGENNLFNDINKYKMSKISDLQKLLKKDAFLVPYYVLDTAWGNEKIYMPFTSNLFKIITTSINDTSVQIHPLKNESWYSLNDVEVYDGKNILKIGKNHKITIRKCTVHSLKKGGRVFEVQDNIPFDYDETLRIYDSSNRSIQPSKFNAYSFIHDDKIKIENNEMFHKKCSIRNSFIFAKEPLEIRVKSKKIKINKEDLWYVKGEFEIIDNIKEAIVIPAKYYKEK